MSIDSNAPIRRIYIKEGFDEEPVGYDIGMIAKLVDYTLENGDISNVQDVLEAHFGSYVFTKQGAHGIRYWDGNLSVAKIDPETHKPIIDPTTGEYDWYDIPIGGGTDLEIDGVLDPTAISEKHTAKVYWIDPQDIMLDNKHVLVEWGGTRVVRTLDNYTTNPDDPDAKIICDIERDNTPDHGRNQHSTEDTAIIDNGEDLPSGQLEYGQVYYYTFFTFKKLSNGDRKYSTGENVKKVSITPHEVIIEEVPYQKSEKENLPMYEEDNEGRSIVKTPHFENNTDELAFTITGETSASQGRLPHNHYYANFTPTIYYVWSDAICQQYQINPQDPLPIPWRIRPQEINIPEVTGPIDPEDSKIVYTYNRDGAGGVTQGPTITYKELTPEDDNDNYDMIILTDNTGINVNNYTLKIHLDNPNENDTNYIWKTRETRDDITIDWKIITKLLPKPELDGDGNYDYDNGNIINVELKYYNPIYITGNNLSEINADTYTATFDLKNEESVEGNKNLKWEDNTFNQIQLTWVINPKEIAIPSISEPGKQLVYNGQEQNIEPYIVGYDNQYMTLTNSDLLIETEADDYGLIFKLNNDTERNYAWKDVPGARMYANQTVYWTIHKAENNEWTLDYPYKNGILPYNFGYGSTVVYNNKIHILGGQYGAAVYKNHYSWDGVSWTKEADLPYNFYQGSAVVYNNRIHILGGGGVSPYTQHYSWAEGETTWTEESTLPYGFYQGSAVVHNNKIHIMGGRTTNKYYTWPEKDDNNNIIWKQHTNLLYNSINGVAVIFNNTIYLINGGTATNQLSSKNVTYLDTG